MSERRDYEIENLKEQLYAIQAREAMLVDALKAIAWCNDTEWQTVCAKQALQNSTEHTAKWLAEVEWIEFYERVHQCYFAPPMEIIPTTQEDYKKTCDALRNLLLKYPTAQKLRRMASILRSGK